MVSKIRKGILIGIGSLLIAGGYYAGLYLADLTLSRNSPKISSQEHLESVVEEEKRKLNCENDITAVLIDFKFSATRRRQDGHFSIVVGGSRATEYNARHETFHACDRSYPRGKINRLHYLLWLEPRAIAYGSGILSRY